MLKVGDLVTMFDSYNEIDIYGTIVALELCDETEVLYEVEWLDNDYSVEEAKDLRRIERVFSR